ncbi:DUF3307 domain-containing protein [Pseudalkalibacillus berkeleyi]|uniref:DUF3307 domain-containing protein n=1 Tax=Pseudalkalibacillus berkeleyi TaxID=1069813 RepID=A0ABS9H053_9BACL|nr:DUF3307 domain-containing protein [Pseudalkalibacillus berkeleyi]MCF6137396.1 DUF3307 domain-containing protein [Pseudalkalibacillus berkeleyi]
MFQLLLLFILAHFIADFVIQSNAMIRMKKTHLHKGLFLHIITHFILMIGVALVFIIFIKRDIGLVIPVGVAIILILILHYLIDWTKEILNKKSGKVVVSASLFIFDQFVHIISILFIFQLLGLTAFQYSEMADVILRFLFEGVELSDLSKLFAICIIIVLATEGAGYFLGIILRNLGPSQTLNKNMYSITDEKTEIKTYYNEKGEEVNEVTTLRTDQFYRDSPKQIGRYIGMIERVLIMIFIVQGIPHGMTFLIAVKSLTRFKQFESKAFAEYYLIGSLLSATIGIVLGYAILRII